MKLPLHDLQVWIINLNRSGNRWQRCFGELTQVFSPEQLHRVDALDGLDFLEGAEAKSSRWNPLAQGRLEREGVLLPEQILDPVYTALCLSHQRALQLFLNSGDEWGLIFEDDACLADKARIVSNDGGVMLIPEDAEVLFLHDRVLSRKLGRNSAILKKTANAWGLEWRVASGGIGLEAYAVNRVGARKILAAWQPVVMECDLQLMTFLRGRAASQQVKEIHAVLGKDQLDAAQLIKAYALNEPLFVADERLGSVKVATMEEAGVKPDASLMSGGATPWQRRLAATTSGAGSTWGVARSCSFLSETRVAARGLHFSRSAALRGLSQNRCGRESKQRATALSSMSFSFCVTAKERTDHLRETLPHNLRLLRRFGGSELVLLNYNSQDDLAEFVLDHFKAELRSGLLRFATTRQPERYRHAHAKNVCHRLGSGEFLINLDADQFLNDAYMNELNQAVTTANADVCPFVYDANVYGGGYGRVAIRRGWFEKLGGYDEDHTGYGHDDFDLVQRAKLGRARVVSLNSATAEFIKHGDERRALANRDQERDVETAQWRAFFEAKWAKGDWIANHNREWGVVGDLEQYAASNPLDLTVVLTNYRRPGNMARILDSLPEGVEVMLLDNAPLGFEVPKEIIRRVDWYVKSDGNDLVLRWLMVTRARTKFFCVLDDDICLKNWQPYMEKLQQVSTLVGPFGVDLETNVPGRCYSRGSHAMGSRECDVVKGRAVFGRVRELRRVFELRDLDQVNIDNDDVFVSSLFREKHHVLEVPDNIVELQDNDALSHRRLHLQDRDVSAMKFFLERSHLSSGDRRYARPVMPSRGVVWCASPGYHVFAMRVMESLRQSNPMLPVYCHPAAEGRASREAKLSVDQWSPFEETLFIDCDTVVCADLAPVFDLLRDASLYMAKETPKYTTLGSIVNSGWIREEVSDEYWEKLKGLPADTPLWNSGVILFRKNEATHKFFENWRRRWVQRGANTLDQLPLTELMVEQGPPAELPPYWHCQVSSQNPKAEIPEAAIYHFMGTNKEAAYRRWKRSRAKVVTLALLDGKQP